jgi:hypothetical protein
VERDFGTTVGAVSGKRAGGHDLIKPALAGDRGEFERTRGVIWHVCAGLKVAIGVQWSPKRWRARHPGAARQIRFRRRREPSRKPSPYETVPPVPPGSRCLTSPTPHAAENDVIVRVHAAGFTPGELGWPGT